MSCPVFRNPRTIQERREAVAVSSDPDLVAVEVYVRRARSARSLPNDWDDEPRGMQRCWKEQRRTQFKVR
jgi:hypothetical protein